MEKFSLSETFNIKLVGKAIKERRLRITKQRGPVPRSIFDAVATNSTEYLWVLKCSQAAKEHNVASFTYAASSSTYGDHPAYLSRGDMNNPVSVRSHKVRK